MGRFSYLVGEKLRGGKKDSKEKPGAKEERPNDEIVKKEPLTETPKVEETKFKEKPSEGVEQPPEALQKAGSTESENPVGVRGNTGIIKLDIPPALEKNPPDEDSKDDQQTGRSSTAQNPKANVETQSAQSQIPPSGSAVPTDKNKEGESPTGKQNPETGSTVPEGQLTQTPTSESAVSQEKKEEEKPPTEEQNPENKKGIQEIFKEEASKGQNPEKKEKTQNIQDIFVDELNYKKGKGGEPQTGKQEDDKSKEEETEKVEEQPTQTTNPEEEAKKFSIIKISVAAAAIIAAISAAYYFGYKPYTKNDATAKSQTTIVKNVGKIDHAPSVAPSAKEKKKTEEKIQQQISKPAEKPAEQPKVEQPKTEEPKEVKSEQPGSDETSRQTQQIEEQYIKLRPAYTPENFLDYLNKALGR
jgi:hypothetical protein